jgi:hypothetical protein
MTPERRAEIAKKAAVDADAPAKKRGPYKKTGEEISN